MAQSLLIYHVNLGITPMDGNLREGKSRAGTLRSSLSQNAIPKLVVQGLERDPETIYTPSYLGTNCPIMVVGPNAVFRDPCSTVNTKANERATIKLPRGSLSVYGFLTT